MDFYNYIEAYVKDRLDPKFRAQMDAAIAADPDLREAVDNYDKIEPVLDLLLEEDLRSQLDKIQQEHSRATAERDKPQPKTRTAVYRLQHRCLMVPKRPMLMMH